MMLCSGCITEMLVDRIHDHDQPRHHRYTVVRFHRAWLSPEQTLSVCFKGTAPGYPGKTNEYTASVALPGTPNGIELFSQYRRTYVQLDGPGVALPEGNVQQGWITESQARVNQLTEVPIVSITAVRPGKARLDKGRLAAERSEALRQVVTSREPTAWVVDDRAYTDQLPWNTHDSFLCGMPSVNSGTNRFETIVLEYCTPDYAEKAKWLLLPVTVAADIVFLPVEAIGCVVFVILVESSGGLHW